MVSVKKFYINFKLNYLLQNSECIFCFYCTNKESILYIKKYLFLKRISYLFKDGYFFILVNCDGIFTILKVKKLENLEFIFMKYKNNLLTYLQYINLVKKIKAYNVIAWFLMSYIKLFVFSLKKNLKKQIKLLNILKKNVNLKSTSKI